MSAPDLRRQSPEPDVLDFGMFVLIFTRDAKVVIAPKEHSKHFTVHLGGRSGIIDAHVTTQGGTPVHEPLGGLRVDDLGNVLAKVQPTFEHEMTGLMRKVLRPVRFGWLGHTGLVALPLPMDEREMLSLGNRRGRRWKVDGKRFTEYFARPLGRREFEAESSPAALLFSRRAASGEVYGAVFRLSDGHRNRFYWFKASEVLKELEALWRRYEPAVRPYLMGPDAVLGAIGAAEGRRDGSATD